jgi:hypothetical protein
MGTAQQFAGADPSTWVLFCGQAVRKGRRSCSDAAGRLSSMLGPDTRRWIRVP